MKPTSLNTVMPETITESLDDHNEVVFVVDKVPLTPISSTQPRTDIQDDDVYVMPPTPDPSFLPSPPPHISPSATITTNFISKQSIVSSTSSDVILVMLRVSDDRDGNQPIIVAAAVNRPSNIGLLATSSINS